MGERRVSGRVWLGGGGGKGRAVAHCASGMTSVGFTHHRATGWARVVTFPAQPRCVRGRGIDAPDYTTVRGEHAFDEGRAVVRAERAGRVDLVAEAREEDFAIALELYLLPGAKEECQDIFTSNLLTPSAPQFKAASLALTVRGFSSCSTTSTAAFIDAN